MARIEDYALLGDCASAALVSRQGSIDWLCWPRFNSGACFAALLGNERSRPLVDRAARRRASARSELSRRDDGPGHDVPHGLGRPRSSSTFWCRTRRSRRWCDIVRGVEGTVDMSSELTIRFDYGLTVPWVARGPHRELLATAGPLKLVLRTSAHTVGRNMRTLSHFKARRGRAGRVRPAMRRFDRRNSRIPATRKAPWSARANFWTRWAAKGQAATMPWADAVQRSLLTLKALTFAQTGGIVAAPDDIAAGAHRRRAQLGLSVLLAARFEPDAAGADDRGLLG